MAILCRMPPQAPTGRLLTFLPLVVGFLAAPSLSAQPPASINGNVQDERGAPIVGARVATTGSCCPRRGSAAKTDGHGQFHLDHTSPVLRIRSEDFEPQSLVLKNSETDLVVTLRPELSKFHVPECREAR